MKQNINKTVSVYNCVGVPNSNSIKVTHIRNLEDEEKERIYDTLTDSYKIFSNLSASVYKCNITNTFLFSSKKIPILYTNVNFTKVIHSKMLCRMFLFFTIDDSINSYSELLKKKIKGKFTLEISIQNKLEKIEDLDLFVNEENIIMKIKHFLLSANMSEYLKELASIEQDLLDKKYGNNVGFYDKIPKPTIRLEDYLDIPQ